jgi:hypothetical protein
MCERSSSVLGFSVALGCILVSACGGGTTSTGAATGNAGAGGTGGAATAGGTGTAGETTTSGNGGTTGTAGATSGAGGATTGAGGDATGAGGAAGTTTGAGGSATGGAGTTGAAGATGTGGATGMANAVPSTGCGMTPPATQTLATFVKYNETITASALVTAKWQPRDYWVWLPSNYDPKHAYPTVFVAPGCGGTGNMGIPIQNASGNDAIVIGLDYNAAATGRSCFMTESFPDPEVNYVEQTVTAVEGAFCVDKSRLFIEGFSSGSWISYLMGCVDGGAGGIFKAQGNASGELQGSVPANACRGPVPYMAGHNNPDSQNAYPGARDHMIKINGCTEPPVTMPYTPPSMVKPPTMPAGVTINCVQYQGCMVPTIFCTTTGLDHNDQVGTGISTYGFWNFWMSLP